MITFVRATAIDTNVTVTWPAVGGVRTYENYVYVSELRMLYGTVIFEALWQENSLYQETNIIYQVKFLSNCSTPKSFRYDVVILEDHAAPLNGIES